MKALVFHKPHDVRFEDWTDPKIQHVRDAIIRVTATTICGSDLHIYNGYVPQARKMVLGHEFMGVVEEVGPRVSNLKKGDRVVVPFPIACGECFFCKQGLQPQCERSNPRMYGPDGTLTEKGGGLFGYTDLYGGYDGGQAEYVRVPYADYGPKKVPDGLTDEQVLFLTDILPTGWCGAEWAGVKEGDTVAVWGCGPVGLCAMKSARAMGAKRVIGIDILEYRLKAARKLAGADTINAELGDPVEILRSLTAGRGPDCAVDCVGMEAEHGLLESAGNLLTARVGTTKVLNTCLRAVRRGGRIGVIGVYPMNYRFPLGQFFDKGLSMRAGQALPHNYIEPLMAMIQEGKLRADDLITHRLKLEDGPEAYRLFKDKKEDCLKLVLTP